MATSRMNRNVNGYMGNPTTWVSTTAPPWTALHQCLFEHEQYYLKGYRQAERSSLSHSFS